MNIRCALKMALAVVLAGVAVQFVGAQEASGGVPVHMLVSVEARHGSNVPTINKEDVMVYEGRTRDKVMDWVPMQGDHAALDLFLLLDDGSSSALGTQLEDLHQFIRTQPSTTRVGVAYMQDGIAQIAQNPTSDHELAAKALRLPLQIPGINASPYFSLEDLIKRWPESGARREVVMVSDGIDRYWGSGPADPYVPDAVEQAQRAGIIVFGIYMPGVGHFGHSYWGNYWGQIYLSQLTDETGGEGYYIGFTGAPVAFSPYLDNVEKRLSHQYLLTFAAKPEKKAGMRRIRLTTEVPNAELVAPQSVYVPAGP
jgi:hypothetical protein